VARVRHVRVDLWFHQRSTLSSRTWCRKAYTSVSTVCSSALLGGLVDLDVLYDQIAGIETLGISVCLRILEETEQEFGGLDWPSSAGNTELLACIILSTLPKYRSASDR
jgi:hypothetical protein